MRAIHGNGPHIPPLSKPPVECITCATLNIGGFSDPTKWLAIKQIDFDTLALSETHLQFHTQHSLHIKFPNHHFIHSPGKDGKHYTGVALLTKKAICWSHKLVEWPKDSPCYSFFQDNRLMCVQFWTGDGSSCIFVYIAYNPSGARWETDKKTYSHRLFEAVNQDLQQRGDITAIFCGDFNLTIEDSEILQRWYKHGPWFDSHMSLAHPTPEIMRPAIRVKVLE